MSYVVKRALDTPEDNFIISSFRIPSRIQRSHVVFPLSHIVLYWHPCRFPKRHDHTFFVPRMTSPLTLLQSISLSIPSSTSPQTTTLSPRIRYRPCSISELGSGSSGVRIMRSTVCVRTRFVSWSVERRVPRRVRPSTVMTRTFSAMC